jgi:hypothetical protein
MKFFTALGGFLGFTLVMGIGLAIGRRSAMLLLEASFACVVGGMLFRWWHRLLIQGVQTSLHEKRVAAQAAKAAQTPVTVPRQPARP